MTVLSTAKEFYDFFNSIPVWKWTTKYLENFHGQRCALGHIRAKFGSRHWNPTEDNLHKICEKLHPENSHHEFPIATINDFGVLWIRTGELHHTKKFYPQWTSKGRVLAMLRTAMKAGL